MATASLRQRSKRLPEWAFGASVGTKFPIINQGGSTPLPEITPISYSGQFEHTSLSAECLQLKVENAALRAQNESLKAKVVAMQTITSQAKKKQIGFAAIIGGIVSQIKEEFPKFPLISSAYYALSEQINEISINVVMDSLDYDTEKELTKFFIKQEDKFSSVTLQTRFLILSIEESDELFLKQGSFSVGYKRDK